MDNLNNLIPELENIVGDYTDETDYKKLIQLDPKIHSHDKLLIKQLSDVPVDLLLEYREMYNLALQFNETNTFDYYLSPQYLTGLFIQFKSLYPNLHTLSDFKSIRHTMGNTSSNLFDFQILFEYIVSVSIDVYDSNVLQNVFTDSETILEEYGTDLENFTREQLYESDTNIDTIQNDLENFIQDSIDEVAAEFFSNKDRYIDKANLYLSEYLDKIYIKIKQIILEVKDGKRR